MVLASGDRDVVHGLSFAEVASFHAAVLVPWNIAVTTFVEFYALAPSGLDLLIRCFRVYTLKHLWTRPFIYPSLFQTRFGWRGFGQNR